MNKRLHIFYSGAVQGVGFRYSAESVASRLALSGWVSNLRDGRVECVLEGPEPELNKFTDRMSDIFGGYIRDAALDWSEATGEFSGFDIRI